MNLLTHLFGKSARRKNKLARSRRGFLETLEDRRLMVATVLSTTPTLAPGTVGVGGLSVQINFSQPVLNANLSSSYEIRKAGTDGLLNTADDTFITPNVSYTSNTATLTLTNLVEDSYLLTVKDAILDAATSQALDGDGDGIFGRVFQKDFLVGNQVKGCGLNSSGQLGIGNTTNLFSSPVGISGFSDVISLEAFDNGTIALKSDGTVWTWGYNNSGQLGDGTTTTRSVPGQVPGLANVLAVTGGSGNAYALKSDGTVWAWGQNSFGLGTGGTSSAAPAQVIGLSNVVDIEAGSNHCLALLADGTVWAWGYNGLGQLGDTTFTNRSTPVPVVGVSGVKSISATQNGSMVVLKDGTIRTWGDGGFGQIGNGSPAGNVSIPYAVPGLNTVISGKPGGMVAIVALKNGTVDAWGSNQYGSLGDGTLTSHYSPAPVINISNAVKVDNGWEYALVQLRDGTVRSFGHNIFGSLGNGTSTNSSTPVTVIGLNSVRSISSSNASSMFLRNTPVTPLSFYRQTPVAQSTSADSLIYQVKFNDDVYDLDAADFTVSGTTATVTNVTAVNARTYNVTISGGDLANLNGTVGLSFAASAYATDRYDVPVVMNQPLAVESYSVLNNPTVNNITRAVPLASSTNAASVTFNVKFSEAVSGVDAGDFVITAPGATGTSVTNITSSDQINYKVTVATGTGTGNVRLDFNATASGGVTSVASGALSTTNFTTGEVYDLHRSVPTTINLDKTSVAENLLKGTLFANLTTTDADPGEAFTYAFATGTGATDNTSFTLQSNTLKTNAVFDYETKKSYSIRLRATDSSGLFVEQPLTISINDVNEAPTSITLLNKIATLDQSLNTANSIKVAGIQITDDALGTNNVTLTGADAALFQIAGNELQLIPGAILQSQTNPVLDVTVVVDDPTVGNSPDASVSLSIAVTDNPPIAVLQDGSDTVVYGTSGNDRIYVTVLDNEVHVYVNSQVYITTADDQSIIYIYGKGGNDYISMVKTSDPQLPMVVDAGAGNDTVFGGAGNDTLIGGAGNDRLYAGDGDNTVWGDNANDWISGVGAGSDTLTAGSGNDLLYGGGGNDTLQGYGGDDQIYGGDGVDILNGGTGNDILRGGTGKDTLTGGTGDDILLGGTGNDYLYGNDGNDLLIGGTGKDTLSGGNDDDILLGGLITAFEDQADIDSTQLADSALIGLLSQWFTPGTLFDRRAAVLASGEFAPEDDGEKDTLSGDTGFDWVLAGAVDLVPGISGDLKESI